MKVKLPQSIKKIPSITKVKTNQNTSVSSHQLKDNRKTSIALSGIAEMKKLGPQGLQLKSFEGILNSNSPIQKMDLEEEEPLQGKFETIQKQGLEEEELVQGKFKTIQKMDLEEEEPLQGKFEIIQKQGLEEEELMQGKFETAQKMSLEEEEPLQGKFETIQKQENNTGLPDNLKSGIENLSGYSMDDVKVHYNSDKPATLQAHAYAQGTDIHLASGQEKHLPHEAWHVVQQKQGRVKPTIQLQGKVNVNDDAGLEKEADVMGAQALQQKSEVPDSSPHSGDLMRIASDEQGYKIEQRRIGTTIPSGSSLVLQGMKGKDPKSAEYQDLESQKVKQDAFLDTDLPALATLIEEEKANLMALYFAEWNKFGTNSGSYTPYYKNDKYSRKQRIAWRMCEDNRMGKEPGHGEYSKQEFKQYTEERAIQRHTELSKLRYSARQDLQQTVQLQAGASKD